MSDKRTIWKYTLPILDRVEIEMPAMSFPLSVDVQRDTVCLWAVVDPECANRIKRVFRIVGTGHIQSSVFHAECVFLGTCVTAGGSLVWHVYEQMETTEDTKP